LEGYTPVGSAFTAAYDSDNRLTNLSYAGNQITFSYLGNILLKKTVNGVETRYVYDGFQIMQERNDRNNVVNEYTYGLGLPGGIGGLLRLNQGGTPYSYLFDGKGNVTVLLNGAGQVAATYQYDPFGAPVGPANSLIQPMQFSTKPYDEETGLSYYGYRFYAPTIGRWMTRDPIGEAGGINLYAFVVNSPVNLVDPFGLAPGDAYSTWTDAALNALRDAYPASYANNWEYGGRLYQNPDGTYSYTPARTDRSPNSVTPCMPIPKESKCIGDYHTHGRPDPRYPKGENFSPEDIQSINNLGSIYGNYVGALMTPSGVPKAYVPGSPVFILK
jgi:RHS repeat-associated protein